MDKVLKIVAIVITVVGLICLLFYIAKEILKNKIWKDLTGDGIMHYKVWRIIRAINVVNRNRDYFFKREGVEISETEREVFKKIFEALLENSIQYIKESKDFDDTEERFYVLESFSNEVRNNKYLSQFFCNEMSLDNILTDVLLKNHELIEELGNNFFIKYGQVELRAFCEKSCFFSFSQEKNLFKFDFTKPISSHRQAKEA